MTKATILIAEDEKDLMEIMEAYLSKEGYRVLSVSDGSEVLDIIRQERVSLLLLDIMLPKVMGFDVLESLRQFSEIPVIMITSLSAEDHRLRGFELGADDYICKPFSPREVVARVKSILRRIDPEQLASSETPGQAAPLILDEGTYTASVYGNPVGLTASEFKLLGILAQRPNCIFSRNQLLDEVTGTLSESSYRAIDSHIKNVRKKLSEHAPGETIIQTVYGVGYKLNLPFSVRQP